MTLKQFSEYAIEIAKDYGIEKNQLSIMACVFYGTEFHYTIQAWDNIKRNHIRSSQQNPSSSLSEFSNKLKEYFREYSKEINDITIT